MFSFFRFEPKKNGIVKICLSLIFFFSTFITIGQTTDTINGFQRKISGEEINYYSPLHQFADLALLTRANGKMPVEWEAPVYKGKGKVVCYELLIGHSTGTSSGDRQFEVRLNGEFLFVITTHMKQKGFYSLKGNNASQCKYQFIQQDYDLNNDAFGKLYISVPADRVSQRADFSLSGWNQNSRDWMMVFMYRKQLKILVQPTNLVLRKENKRQVNILLDNPNKGNSDLQVIIRKQIFNFTLKEGYNKLSLPAYNADIIGYDQVLCILNKKDSVFQSIELKPISAYEFHLIHHSHNDIGYSHLQTEVAQIQNRNISSAIRWIEANSDSTNRPYWHIESLWAVENFLNIADLKEIEKFVSYVKNGQLVLSANYANILTGLCQPEELAWAIEYAKYLEKRFGFTIANVMTTDIPGLSRSGFQSYIDAGIPYLSFGPNYVKSLPDHGDRIGSMLKEQGDKVFYWQKDSNATQKLLVWTAGKGYSCFHGITEGNKQESWEQRISDYCEELLNQNYPYEMVQLRYTKISDNGPVDTLLCSFVENWNLQFSIPKLTISSLDNLFRSFEKKYKDKIPVYSGEISPYWEDGAYSTAVEEMQNRELALKTIALEKFAKTEGQFSKNEDKFYRLHRNIILFHEHTWGSWCSISDPEIAFTTEQWKIKKAFLDSAQIEYNELADLLSFNYNYNEEDSFNSNKNRITDFSVDTLHGGLRSILVEQQNIVSDSARFRFFEPVYALGINPVKTIQTSDISTVLLANNKDWKVIVVKSTLPGLKEMYVIYSLMKKEGKLSCYFSFNKEMVKEKESMHISMPFAFKNPVIKYGSANNLLQYNKDQLPGSNKEFVCVEKYLKVQSGNLSINISSPEIALYEIGNMINENQTNGHKIWKTENTNTSDLFLYVFNNYWHTNYKAFQEGRFNFSVELRAE